MGTKEKWKIYIITLVNYALVHSIRTLWASIKSNLTIPPFNYKVWLIGTIDMIVLFLIGVCMNIFGHRVSYYGAKKTLVIILSTLLVLTNIVGIFLYLNLTEIALYIIFYGFGIGISSSLAWPSCLYMVSFYFDQKDRIYLSLWNGSSQLGQFIALITYFAISTTNQLPPQGSFFIQGAYILIILIIAIVLLPNKMIKINENAKQQPNLKIVELQQNKQQYLQIQQEQGGQKENDKEIISNDKLRNIQNQEKIENIIPGQNNPVDRQAIQIKSQTGSQSQVFGKQQQNKRNQTATKRVGIFSVWLLPGVALNTLALGFTKSVNAIIISWMVYYLISIDLGTEAIIITILWSIGVILGGLICSYLNKNLSYLFFAVELLAAALCFILLQQFHTSIFQTQIFISVIICALFFGGPFNLLHTAIPLYLSNQIQVQQYENGKAAIISLTQSFALICCGLSLLIIPPLGIHNMHIVCSIYCFIGCFLLLGQNYRKGKVQELNKLRQRLKRKVSKAIK